MHRIVLTATATPIFGYVRGEAHPPRLLYQSLVHWHQAMRFDNAQLHLEAALLPTEVEVRRFALRNRTNWRADWSLVERAFVCLGLKMLCLQNDDAIAPMGAHLLARFLEPLALISGVRQDVIQTFVAWQSLPRVIVYGADQVSEGTLGVRMSRLLAKGDLGTLVLPARLASLALLHQWAISNRVAVMYFGDPLVRPTTKVRVQMQSAANIVVVFVARGTTSPHEGVMASAKDAGKRVIVERFDSSGSRAGSQVDAFSHQPAATTAAPDIPGVWRP